MWRAHRLVPPPDIFNPTCGYPGEGPASNRPAEPTQPTTATADTTDTANAAVTTQRIRATPCTNMPNRPADPTNNHTATATLTDAPPPPPNTTTQVFRACTANSTSWASLRKWLQHIDKAIQPHLIFAQEHKLHDQAAIDEATAHLGQLGYTSLWTPAALGDQGKPAG